MTDEGAAAFGFDVAHLPAVATACGLFVTSAGRGEGKTLVAGAIARHLRRAGRRVGVLLPVATGCRLGRGGLVSSSADFLAACAESRCTLSEIAPVRTALPTAPPAAAGDRQAVLDAWRGLSAGCEAVVVESAGGILGPITDDFWSIHLAKLLALPVVVVVRPGVAAVEGALQAVDAARSAGLAIAGVVVNRYRTDTVAEEDVEACMQTQADRIARLGRLKVLALVPDDAANDVARAALADSARFAVDQAPWEQIIFGGG